MSTLAPGVPAISGKTSTIITSILFGIKLLPFFVQGVETLYGKKTGQTKKQAVSELFNASVTGVAGGFGLAGDPAISQAISALQPAVSNAIDNLAATYFPSSGDVNTSPVAG